jgi:hypothetical protein
VEFELVGHAGFPLPLGAVWLNGHGRVVSWNHCAWSIVAEHDGLLVVDGRLVATRADEAFELKRLVNAVCGGAPGPYAAGGATRISRTGSRPPVTLLVSPLRWPSVAVGIEIPVAVIFMNDPTREPQTWQDVLRCRYELTRSEAEVALLVLRGGAIDTIARERKTSRNTARTHLAGRPDPHRAGGLHAADDRRRERGAGRAVRS